MTGSGIGPHSYLAKPKGGEEEMEVCRLPHQSGLLLFPSLIGFFLLFSRNNVCLCGQLHLVLLTLRGSHLFSTN